MKNWLKFSLIAAVFSAVFSCSTTRVLRDDQYRLAKNEVTVTNDDEFDTKEIQSYIRQKANSNIIFGWNPFLNIYNMSSKSGKGFISSIFRSIGVAPVVYDPDLLSSSVENIGKHLEYIGYYGSDVKTEVSINKKKVTVDYIVTLGKRYPVSSITYSLPDRGEIKEDFLADTSNVTIHPGDYLSEEALDAESSRSSAYLRELGYYGFNKNYFFFEADTLGKNGTVALDYRIAEYTRNELPKDAKVLRKSKIGDVKISYPKSLYIREKTLRNLNTIYPGDTYSESAVNNTYNRLSSMTAFSSLNIELNQTDTATVNCDIKLTPGQLQGFKTNLEGSVNSSGLFGISPELSYYHKNIFRGGEILNVSFMGNFQFKPNDDIRSTELGTSMSLNFPRFLFLPQHLFKKKITRTEFKASYNYQDRPEYRRNIISTSLGYNGSHKKLYYQFYPVQLNIVRLHHIDSAFYSSLANNPFMKNAYQNHFDLGKGGTLYYTTNTDIVPKTTYHYARLNVSMAGNVLSAFKGLMNRDDNGAGMIWGTPFSQYIRGELTLGKTWRFGRNNGQAIATRFIAGAGYAYGNSTVLPFEQHFYSGGASSLRGWQARSIGPGIAQRDSNFVIPNQTGDMKLEANAEYRFSMFWKIAGAVFVDAGNVWTFHDTSNNASESSKGKFSLNNFGESIAANWGLGLRLDLNFILIRLDMGMPFHDPSKESGQRWRAPSTWLKKGGYAVHFGVGYPF